MASSTLTNDSSKAEAIEAMLKTLTMLSSEVIDKRAELERIKALIKQGKGKYNAEIRKYSSLTKEIIKLEEDVEVIESQNAKKKTAQHLIIMSINKDFFKNCLDVFSQIPFSVYKVLFKVCGYESEHIPSECRLFNTVIKDDNELRALIENVDKVQHDYYMHNDLLFNAIRREVLEVNVDDVLYPYDVFFDYFRLVYEVIQNNKAKALLLSQIDSKNDTKNETFLGLKALESEIMSNDETFHSLANHIKGTNSLLNSYKQLKSTNASSEVLLLFASRVRDFKQFSYNSLVKVDIMTSLTVQSEYSEDKSEIASVVDMKYSKDSKSAISSLTQTSFSNKKNAISKESGKLVNIKKSTKPTASKSNSNISENGLFGVSLTPMKKTSNSTMADNNQKQAPSLSKAKPKPREQEKAKNDFNSTNKSDNIIQHNTVAQEVSVMPLSPMIDMHLVKDIDSVCDEIEDSLPIKNISLKSAKKFTYPAIKQPSTTNQNRTGRNRALKDLSFLRFEKPVSSSDCCVACT